MKKFLIGAMCVMFLLNIFSSCRKEVIENIDIEKFDDSVLSAVGNVLNVLKNDVMFCDYNIVTSIKYAINIDDNGKIKLWDTYMVFTNSKRSNYINVQLNDSLDKIKVVSFYTPLTDCSYSLPLNIDKYMISIEPEQLLTDLRDHGESLVENHGRIVSCSFVVDNLETRGEDSIGCAVIYADNYKAYFTIYPLSGEFEADCDWNLVVYFDGIGIFEDYELCESYVI